MSGDPISSAGVQAGVGTALSMRTERALLDCIPVNNHLCAVLSESSVRVKSSWFKCHCLFVVSVYAFPDCTFPEFCGQLSQLLWSAPSIDVLVAAGDFDAQRSYLQEKATLIRSRFFDPADRTYNGDRHL